MQVSTLDNYSTTSRSYSPLATGREKAASYLIETHFEFGVLQLIVADIDMYLVDLKLLYT